MARDFKPSSHSQPADQTVAALRYLEKASAALEKRIVADGDAPPWVKNKIREASVSLGLAVSYMKHKEKKG